MNRFLGRKAMKKLLILIILIFILSSCQIDLSNKKLFDVGIDYETEFYTWIVNNQLDNGLVKTTEDGQTISLYDNALAAIVFTMKGDYDKARKIFDFFDERIESELNDQYGGFAQFRNSDGNFNGIGMRWLGDNAWLLIAINNYQMETNTQDYAYLELYLNLWIRGLQNSDGSLSSGVDENGNKISPVTEGMIDAYNAIEGNDTFHKNLYEYLMSNRYDEIDDMFIAWPGNESYKYSLDISSWGYLAFDDMPISMLTFADQHFLMTRNNVTGYCADEDLDSIFTEHSLQMATAYAAAGSNYYSNAESIIENMNQLVIDSNMYDDAKGLPYASNQATVYGSGLIWDGADTKIHLSGTAWYLMALYGYNPFEAGLKKDK